MTKALIPLEPPSVDLAKPNAEFQKAIFLKRRKDVLDELRCISVVPEIARTLNQDTVYKLVCTPEGGKLYKDVCGNIKGVFYKDGKILEHATFKTFRPSFIKVATAIGSQILLISIAMQLNNIEEGILRIIGEFHSDRISEIFSGINLYHQAMLVQDLERQTRIIENAVQILNSGIEKTVRSLKKQIDNAPEANLTFLDNWGINNKTRKASNAFLQAEESFYACLSGIKILYECYATMNEPRAALYALNTNFANLKSAGIESAVNKARLVPFTGERLPEKPWIDFIKNEPLFLDRIKSFEQIVNNEFDCIEIEVNSAELMEKDNE